MHSRTPTTVTALALVLAVNATGCTDLEADDDDQFRDSFAQLDPEPEPKQPPPDPHPTPSPDPISAEHLVGKHIEDVLATSSWVDSYTMSPYPSASTPFNVGADPWYEWPLHAMEWKDYASGQSYQFDFAAAEAAVDNSPSYIGTSVHAGDIVELDDMLTQGVVFHNYPGGQWMEATFTDPAEGLVFAALVMHFWRTPVYSAAEHFDHQTNGSVMSHTVALQQLEFTLVSAPDIFAACGLSKATATTTTSLGVVPYCDHATILTGDEVSLWNSIWGAPSSWTPYQANVQLAASDLIAAYNNNYMGEQGQLVFDPPSEANEEDLAGLAVLAEALADQTLVADADGTLVMLRDYLGQPEG